LTYGVSPDTTNADSFSGTEMRPDIKLDALIDDISSAMYLHILRSVFPDDTSDFKRVPGAKARVKDRISEQVPGYAAELRKYLAGEIRSLRSIPKQERLLAAIASKRHIVVYLLLDSEQ
jgi:hypothetical protein